MSLELQLFVEQAGWLAPRLQDPTRIGVINWLGRRLERVARQRFITHFPLSHAVQRRGETAVCALLQRSIVVHATKVLRVSEVTRAVDWPATYACAHLAGRPPQPLLVRKRDAVPDRASLGALVSLGRSWTRLLELAADHPELGFEYLRRRTALRAAMPPQLIRGLAPAPYGSRHASRLRRLDDEAAFHVASIEQALGFWRRSFGASATDDSAALSMLARLLDEADAKNIDTLLEATVALSIARAAVNADRADWPTLFPWTVLAVDEPRSMYPVIRLRSADLVCEIAKGTPRAPSLGDERAPIADLLSPWADEVLPSTGRARSTGRQPDLVVSFHLEGDPSRVVFALGDAKRNATGDGESYIRAALDVAATYLMAFGYRMGLRLPGPGGGALTTDLMPGVSLFCRQGTGRDAASAIALLRADRAAVVMAFDLENHLEPEARPWHAPVLAAWLGSLGRQAIRVLGSTGGSRRRGGGATRTR
ncbi:MAG TPA: hypothetical protein VI197_02455 [Polyangiaceae bacterium]